MSTEAINHSVLTMDLTWTWVGMFCLALFVIGLFFIINEAKNWLNKSIPALFLWTLMHIVIWVYFIINGLDVSLLQIEIQAVIIEVVEIFFFLFVAMTYIEVLIERNAFEVLKQKLVAGWHNYKKLFWLIGFLAFFLSPLVDNLTTALILVTVISTITRDPKFLLPTAINIVVAANAWWAWSPFGDITTLMAWTAGKWSFSDFLYLFPSAFIGWVVTAYLLSLFLPNGAPKKVNMSRLKELKVGTKRIIGLWLFTIFMAVMWHQLFHLPAMWWMMFGLSLLKLYTYRLHIKSGLHKAYIFEHMRKVEVDTLLFFFGILSAVWWLSFLGYLVYITEFYTYFWDFFANAIVWIIAAIAWNVAVMSSVLKSSMDMWIEGWLLLTLVVWVGGSLISFWSAAWIGVMGRLRGVYTFYTHMKFFPVILIWYIVSLLVFYIQFNYIPFLTP